MDYFKGIQGIKNIFFWMGYFKNQHNKKQERRKKHFKTVSCQWGGKSLQYIGQKYRTYLKAEPVCDRQKI